MQPTVILDPYIGRTLSYTRADDNASAGMLSKARALLEKRVHVKYGHKLDIFQDTDDIKYGDNWKRRLQSALNDAKYLLPVITPSFFNSEPCREELSRFLEKSKGLGRDDLVVPILFLDTPALGNVERKSKDSLIEAINQSQWADWRAHEDKIAIDQNFHSDINRLAQRLVEKIIEDDSAESSKIPTLPKITHLDDVQKERGKIFPGHNVTKVIETSSDSKFLIGDRVFHQKFGYGAVEQIDDDKLSVAFEKAGTKKVVATYVTKADKAAAPDDTSDEIPF